MKISRVIQTDVLTIGGSGASITAAISAIRSGVNTTIVSKGKIGKTGNAIMAGGGFSLDGKSAHDICKQQQADVNFTKEIRFDNMVKESCYLGDQKLIQQYVDDSPKIFEELLQWGKRANQLFVFLPPNFWFSAGRCWGNAIKQGLKEHDKINVFEDTTIIDLLVKENKVVGAIGLDIYSGELILFKAKAVILGTGGFQPYSFKNTVTDMTGDGPAMALRAGARLADMEFLLFFPTAISPNEIKGSIYPYMFEVLMGATGILPEYRDVNGEVIKIPEKALKLSKGSKLGKLVTTYYWGKSVEKGKGTKNNGIYWDYSRYSKEELDKAINKFFDNISHWYKKGFYQGEDMTIIKEKILNNEYLEIGPCCEYSNGGILINEKMETDIKGLFAGGEAASGVFGAMRVGDGLTEMIAQGYRAGISASEFSKTVEHEKVDNYQVDQILEELQKILKNDKGINPFEVKKHLEFVADEGFSFYRNEEKFNKAFEMLDKVKDEISCMSIKNKSSYYNLELLTAIQNKNLLVCLETGMRAAQMRKESRGCHIRTDYPEVNHDDWCVRLTSSLKDEKLEITKSKPNVTKNELPRGKHNNVIDFYTDEKTNYSKYMK